MKYLLSGIVSALAIFMITMGVMVVTAPAHAQWDGPPRARPDFGWIDRNGPSKDLSCTVRRRADRDGNIVWLALNCNAGR